MNNNDNCDCEFVYNIERKILEEEEEFIYTIIEPFCETVVEKKLSKAELKQILKKGMQKSIPLDQIKQVRDEMQEKIHEYSGSGNEVTQAYCDGFKDSLAILDNLTAESEEK